MCRNELILVFPLCSAYNFLVALYLVNTVTQVAELFMVTLRAKHVHCTFSMWFLVNTAYNLSLE